MAANPQTTFSNAFSLMKMYWFRLRLGANQTTGHSLSEPITVSLLTHVCVTRLQWVKMFVPDTNLIITYPAGVLALNSARLSATASLSQLSHVINRLCFYLFVFLIYLSFTLLIFSMSVDDIVAKIGGHRPFSLFIFFAIGASSFYALAVHGLIIVFIGECGTFLTLL